MRFCEIGGTRRSDISSLIQERSGEYESRKADSYYIHGIHTGYYALEHDHNGYAGISKRCFGQSQGFAWGKDEVSARVLLIEDEGLIRMMTAEYLESEGFTVIEACDGDEGIQRFADSGPFDVLFTDVQMPGTLDGLAVAAYARKRYPNIPLLVVSGYAAQLTIRLNALNPPAVFIRKPYDLQDIAAALTLLTAGP